MEKLKIGIIGTGGISQCHLNGYRKAQELCEVTACCDIDFEKAKRYAEKYGIPHVYASCEEMLKAEKLDCVSVCTWNAAHHDCTVAALRAGTHVLCEKPMAMNAKEAEDMARVAKETGKLLQIGFVRRFGNDADVIMNFKNQGVLGDIYYAKAQYLRRDGCPGGWFRDKAFSGGGPLIDLGVHVIDLCRYLAGNPKPVEAFGVTYDNLGPNRAEGGPSAWSIQNTGNHPYSVEDFVSALIRFDNGFTISLESSFHLNIAKDIGKYALYGTKAGVTSDGDLTLNTVMAGRHVDVTPTGKTAFDFENAFSAEIRGFLDAASGVKACRAPAEDGVALMKIIDAIYESAKVGHSVTIS